MSIEKMNMVNLVGTFKDFDKLTKLLALDGIMQPVNALQEINSSDFVLETSTDNIETLTDLNYIRPYSYDKEYNLSLKHIEKLKEAERKFSSINKKVDNIIFDFDIMEKELSKIYSKFKILNKSLEELKSKEEHLNRIYESLHFLRDISTPIEELLSMKNFRVGLYKVSKENMIKIKANYENIPSIVQSLYTEADFVVFIAFTPILMLIETERIFKSANCEEVFLPTQYRGTAKDIIIKLKKEKHIIEESRRKVEIELQSFLTENYEIIKTLANSYELEECSRDIKKTAACTNEFFYLSGWVPQCFMSKLSKLLNEFEDRIIITTKEPNKINNKYITPPTMIRNNKLFSPFQSMVGMYGIPSYNEIDPTVFLAISYTIMFGAMFGDVGQGAVLLLAGIFLKYKMKRGNLGGIFERLGTSSMVFGFLYGSIFGSEEIIDALLIRPMEDINDMLISAVIFGCLLLILGFVLGIINNLRRNDIEHGVFGKEGIVGFMFYIGVLALIVSIFYEITLFPTAIWIIYLTFCLLLILLKQPIANFICGKKVLFEDGPKDYFIEAGFEVVETLLSMFSNTVSFIRVGAFALNHVGLFVAFSAMAEMANNGVASVLIMIIGNIVIIGLEGLIVFIQGLRLQYYELFSKYYEGGGESFEPIQVKFHFNNK